MTAPALELPPVRKTRMLAKPGKNGSPGQMQCWEAEAGEFLFRRLEMPGTPWEPEHKPTGITLRWCSSLRSAREYAADGRAHADLGRVQAHERGDHAKTRDARCVRC